jgi:hypothetical protein
VRANVRQPGGVAARELRAIMRAMPRISRVLLVPDRRDTPAVRDPTAAKIRRYRLARVQLESRAAGRKRFDHLKRIYD